MHEHVTGTTKRTESWRFKILEDSFRALEAHSERFRSSRDRIARQLQPMNVTLWNVIILIAVEESRLFRAFYASSGERRHNSTSLFARLHGQINQTVFHVIMSRRMRESERRISTSFAASRFIVFFLGVSSSRARLISVVRRDISVSRKSRAISNNYCLSPDQLSENRQTRRRSRSSRENVPIADNWESLDFRIRDIRIKTLGLHESLRTRKELQPFSRIVFQSMTHRRFENFINVYACKS